LVRSQLRNVVPLQPTTPAVETVETDARPLPEDVQRSGPEATLARLWILVTGTRHEHMAVADLATALQREGYHVQTVGVGHYSRFFADRGLEYEAHDRPVAWHPQSTKARQWLQEQAELANFTGPDKEEDYLLDLYMLKSEMASGRALRCLLEGKDPEQGHQEAIYWADRFDDFLIQPDSTDLQRFQALVSDVRKETLKWLGEERRFSAENFAPVRQERCKVFRAHLRRVASELGYGPIQVLAAWWMSFGLHLSALGVSLTATSSPADTMKRLMGENRNFLKWYLGEDVKEYWDRWSRKMPAWKDFLSVCMRTRHEVPICMNNVLLSMESAAPEERPALVFCSFELLSPALALQAKYGCGVALLWPSMPPLSLTEHLYLYDSQVKGESQEHMPMRPIRELGPMAFSDLLRSSRQLIGYSPLLLEHDNLLPKDLRSEPPELQALRGCFTGSWVLSNGPVAPDDESHFKDAGERDMLLRFLSECKEPPICLTWGRRGHPKGPGELVHLVAAALRSLCRRGILITGSSGASLDAFRKLAEGMPEAGLEGLVAYAERHVLFVEFAPHEWLFPQCVCTVIHGGRGTHLAALRAGRPVVVAPVGHGPRSGTWARAVGCGVDVPSLSELTPQALGEAMNEVIEDKGMKARVAQLGKTLRAEPGVDGAVALVSGLLRPTPVLQEAKAPLWLDGLWTIKMPEGETVTYELSGVAARSLEGGQQMAWLRSGRFTGEGRPPADGSAHFNVQGWWPGVRVSHGVASPDGKLIVWDNGVTQRYEGRVPQDSGFLMAALRYLGALVSLLFS